VVGRLQDAAHRVIAAFTVLIWIYIRGRCAVHHRSVRSRSTGIAWSRVLVELCSHRHPRHRQDRALGATPSRGSAGHFRRCPGDFRGRLL